MPTEAPYQGAKGIAIVTIDPNLIPELDSNHLMVMAQEKYGGKSWKYDASLPSGARWIPLYEVADTSK